MFGLFKKPETRIDGAIDEVMTRMTKVNDDEEYSKLLTQLERLHKLKAGDSRGKVSSDQLALVLGNLLGILIIVTYEHNHVMTTKAKDFLLKS